jgi:hypothetical protein
MRNLQKAGGIAALYEAAAYIVGMVVYLVVLDYANVVDIGQKMAMLVENESVLYIMNVLIYILFGAALVVLTLALHDRLRVGSPALSQVAAGFGLIWAGLVIAAGMVANIGTGVVVDLFAQNAAQAETVWLAVEVIYDGLGGGNEIVGGLWTLLVSWAALRSAALPRFLNYLGVLVGAAGVVSAIPMLAEIGGMVFGLGQIVWFVWLGIVMLREAQPDSVTQS